MAIHDSESQTSKEVMDYILYVFLGYPCCCSSDSGAVIGLFSFVIQQNNCLATGKSLTGCLHFVHLG